MSAYYDLYETPVPEGEEPKSLHARVCSKGTISGKEFMERVFVKNICPTPWLWYCASHHHYAWRLAGKGLYGGDRGTWLLQHHAEVYPSGDE